MAVAESRRHTDRIAKTAFEPGIDRFRVRLGVCTLFQRDLSQWTVVHCLWRCWDMPPGFVLCHQLFVRGLVAVGLWLLAFTVSAEATCFGFTRIWWRRSGRFVPPFSADHCELSPLLLLVTSACRKRELPAACLSPTGARSAFGPADTCSSMRDRHQAGRRTKRT